MAKKVEQQIGKFNKAPGVDSYKKPADLQASVQKSMMPMPDLGES